MQDTTSPPSQVPPRATNTLPAQPSQNPKSGINALQHKKKKGGNIGDGEKRTYNLWYDLIAQLADEEGESEVESDEEYGGEFWEDKVVSEEENEEDSDGDEDESEEEEENEDCSDKAFFIATLFNNKRVKEEIPAKCEDPGPCLVTCKIKHEVVRECLCDPGACSSVMPDTL
ncbi:hypothetical protein PIB30_093168 [Stylosanthes scabra]|uniref:Uncharacterized protein n=1 Tax=Stylosanthes scabra TaxID=79078 RepID=A0ABU6YSS7_9FABA|nr:hypothetical protein [Stylosanthes scabra]